MTVQTKDFDAEFAPRVVPLSYPGRWPDTSVLLTSDTMWEIQSEPERSLALDGSARSIFRVGHSKVTVPREDRRSLRLSEFAHPFLSDVLERLNVASIDARIPVLAVGSNASPAQMRHKFQELGISQVIPMMRAQLTGLKVGFAPVFAPAGYMPATLFPEPQATMGLFIQWLDENQLRVLDETETGYKRVMFECGTGTGGDVRAVLESGEILGGWYGYVYEGGFLTDDAGQVLMSNQLSPAENGADAGRTVYRNQRELIEMLIGSSEELSGVMGTDADLWLQPSQLRRESAARIIAELGQIGGREHVAEFTDQKLVEAVRYATIMPASLAADGSASRDHFVVQASLSALVRHGQSTVRMGSELYRHLQSPRHVEISSSALASESRGRAPAALAAVLVDDDSHRPSKHVISTGEVDHVLRMAVGLEIGETASIRKVVVRRRAWPDFFIGKPNYETMRVTLADPSTAERDVSLMSRLSLQLLGVESGEHVVIEGSADLDGTVPSMSMKAFELPDYVGEERHAVTRGRWGTRFPSPRDTFGVQPDIATIFLDSAARSRLGILGHDLATVRVRPARGYQFRREVREMMLVLSVALIGIVGLVPDATLAVSLIGVFVGGTVLLVLLRMKNRLSHTLKFWGPLKSRKSRKSRKS